MGAGTLRHGSPGQTTDQGTAKADDLLVMGSKYSAN